MMKTWSKTCQLLMIASVTTSAMEGRISGVVMYRKRCHFDAPSTAAASSTSRAMFCSPARKKSMNVPDVVQMTRNNNAHMATDGPEIHCHNDNPSTAVSASQPGGCCGSTMPRLSSPMWIRPRASLNQRGPLMPNHPRIVLITPALWNRKRNVMLIATELVIDGK